MVEKAYYYSMKAHSGQMRESGETFISHPLGVVMILAELEIDLVTIIAGLLHDVVEDTDITLEEIRQEFGDEVATLVDGVTKLSRLDFTSREEQQAETLRKMFIAMAQDIRVVLIKLADRTHNLRT
ncbi:MAG: HD domain-containing protein, partial [Clostridia bacterium]|nr:HD domain-containing protein [Clostridia bacterium]